MQGKAEVMIAVTHLAFARSQKIGTGISAKLQKKKQPIYGCFFFLRALDTQASRNRKNLRI